MTTTTGRLMTAKYPGTCKGCGRSFPAGTEIRHEGRGLAYHEACPSDPSAVASVPRRRPSSRRGYKSVTTIRTSGGTFYRNSAGRCEDAPCCGCCTI